MGITRAYERVGMSAVRRFFLVALIPFLLVAFKAYAETPFYGALKGSFATSPSGAATYTIPIDVPPGIAGLQPGLALTYNSQGGNGLLGMGWSLGGQSAIHRCPATIVQDGFKGGINFDTDDRFCLDGQRLIPTGTDNIPLYGSGTSYRTEIESFSKIIGYSSQGSGHSYFVAQTKSGQIMEYGNDIAENSRIEAVGVNNPSVRMWALNKVKDAVGNELNINYIEDTVNGQYRPDTIYYANDQQHVEFVYEDRADVSSLYAGGSLVKTTKRLTNVKTFVGATSVRNYRLNYESNLSLSTNRSRLDNIEVCSFDSIWVCKPKTTFDWQDGGNDLAFTGNGSGVTHAFWNTVIDSGTYKGKSFVGDFNGDGKSDLMMIYRDPNSSKVSIYHWHADETGKLAFAGNGNGGTHAYWNAVIDNNTYKGKSFVGDFNGDGKSDLMMIYRDPNSPKVSIYHWNALTPFPDLLKSITNGDDLTTSITYKPITDNAVYTKDQPPQDPDVRNVQAPIYVVSHYETDNGVVDEYGNEGKASVSYTYEGAKFHRLGRGFLGFASRTATTLINGAVKKSVTTSYSQSFPTVGRPTQIDRKLADGTIVESIDNEWDTTSKVRTVNGYSIYHPYLSSNTTTRRDLDGALISTIESSITDLKLTGYGDTNDSQVAFIHVKDKLGNIVHTTTTNATYASPTSYGVWAPWLVTRSELTENNYVDPAVTRTTANDYEYGTGFLKTEIREPDALGNDVDSLYLKTEFTYDSYGNRQTLTISGDSSAPYPIMSRMETTNFDYTVPAFPKLEVINDLNEKEIRIYDARFGLLISSQTPDDQNYSRSTSWGYTSFGAKQSESRIDGSSTSWNYYTCDASSVIPCETNEAYYQQEESSDLAPVTIFFDKLGRELRKVTTGLNGVQVAIDTRYDAHGRIERASRNYFLDDITRHWVVYTYDGLDRVETITAPDNSVTTNAYSGLTATTSRQRIGDNGFVTLTESRTENESGQVVTAVDADNNSTTYSYDPFGNQKTIADSSSNVITAVFDKWGRQTSLDDPNYQAIWQYKYDALGNLRWQQDARSQVLLMTYDVLDRLVIQVDQAENTTSNWEFYTTADPIANRSIGQLKRISRSPGNYEELYKYDTLGRPQETSYKLSGSWYSINTDYHPGSSLLRDVTYPASGAAGRIKVRNEYDSNGYLEKVVDGDNTTSSYWEAVFVNADGKMTMEGFGNTLITTRGFDPVTGLPTTIQTGSAGAVQDLEYKVDSLGNLEWRTDHKQTLAGSNGVKEAFQYDNLNRVNDITLNNVAYQTINYNAMGNITSKTGVGTYAYNKTTGGGPHAVSHIDGVALNYDANGNMTAGRGKIIVYSSDNKPTIIASGGVTTTFDYGPSGDRYKKTVLGNTLYYIGKLFEKEIKSTGVTEYRNMIFAGDQLVSINTKRSNGADELNYVHTDYLGSIDVVTKSDGSVKERMSYDSFGKRRAFEWSDGVFSGLTPMLIRGFTGHEMLDDHGLIHMNGRVYDAEIGRFLSADPFIVDPFYSQDLNRYTYVRNNPHSYTDPSGYFWGRVIAAVIAIVAQALEDSQHDDESRSSDSGFMLNFGTNGQEYTADFQMTFSDPEGSEFGISLFSGTYDETGIQQSSYNTGGYGDVEWGGGYNKAETEAVYGQNNIAPVVAGVVAGARWAIGGLLAPLVKYTLNKIRSGGVTKGGSAGAMRRLEYVASPKHGSSARQTSKGVSNPAPTNGQHVLDVSVRVKGTSPRRVGVDKANGELVVFDQTSKGIFHGHVRSWRELTSQQQNALRNAGLVGKKGNF